MAIKHTVTTVLASQVKTAFHVEVKPAAPNAQHKHLKTPGAVAVWTQVTAHRSGGACFLGRHDEPPPLPRPLFAQHRDRKISGARRANPARVVQNQEPSRWYTSSPTLHKLVACMLMRRLFLRTQALSSTQPHRHKNLIPIALNQQGD